MEMHGRVRLPATHAEPSPLHPPTHSPTQPPPASLQSQKIWGTLVQRTQQFLKGKIKAFSSVGKTVTSGNLLKGQLFLQRIIRKNLLL